MFDIFWFFLQKCKRADLKTDSELLFYYVLLVAGAGFEPATFGLWARRATKLLHPALNDN